MKVLIVYESMFGNTQEIAEAIAIGIGNRAETECIEVGLASGSTNNIDLLVVGGPTHQFGLSRPNSRQQAVDHTDTELVSQGVGIREWIKSLPKVSNGSAATFDTSLRKPNLPGSAARAAQKRLRKLGYKIIAPAEIFLVEDTTGPITDGELDRAQTWAQQLVDQVAPGPVSPEAT